MVEYKGLLINIISSWSPRICGIGSFSQDTASAIENYEDSIKAIKVHPIDKTGLKYIHPIREKHVIRQLDTSSWEKAADMIVERSYRRWAEDGLRSIVLLEHEYGLDGTGLDNNYNLIARKIKEAKIPCVAVLHTVLQTPNEHQKSVIQEFEHNCDSLVVLTPSAKDILKKVYGINSEKIEYIPHGIPEIESGLSKEDAKQELEWGGKIIIATPGLVSEGKGIDYGILGFSEFLKNVKATDRENIFYVIAGQTHPGELEFNKREDPYRRKLEKIVDEEKLNDRVIFINRHLEDNELYMMIKASDVGLTPYRNPQQISSGILSYYVGLGTPCVSTNFTYARDLFSDSKGSPFHINELINNEDEYFQREVSGVLVDFDSPKSIAKGLQYVFENYETIVKNEMNKGNSMAWKVVGASMVNLFTRLVREDKIDTSKISFDKPLDKLD